jgi:hypothetical protein
VTGFGGSVHLHALLRPARDLNAVGSLKGMSATVLNGTGLLFTRIGSNFHCRAAETAACSSRLQPDHSIRVPSTEPPAPMLNSRTITPSSPASRDSGGYTGLTSLTLRGVGSCVCCARTVETVHTAMTAVVATRDDIDRCCTVLLDTGTRIRRVVCERAPRRGDSCPFPSSNRETGCA